MILVPSKSLTRSLALRENERHYLLSASSQKTLSVHPPPESDEGIPFSMKFFFALLAFAGSATVDAAILHDNGSPVLNAADRSDVDTGAQVGDRFTVTTRETIQSIQWWGLYGFEGSAQSVDVFTAQIYTVTGGAPSTTPLLSFSLTGVTRQVIGTANPGGYSVYVYEAAIPNAIVAPGNYVLSLMNNTTADAGDSWFWSNNSQTPGTSVRRNSPSVSWELSDLDGDPFRNHAFKISGVFTVPEAATSSLLATAMGALAVRRRRPHRRAAN